MYNTVTITAVSYVYKHNYSSIAIQLSAMYIVVALYVVSLINYVYKLLLIHYCRRPRSLLLATSSSLSQLTLGTLKLFATATSVT